VDWLCQGNDLGECRRQLCPKVLPCTFEGCGRPLPDPWVMAILALYQDCKERRALPEAGGVMDQRADLMQWFRVIDERIAMRKREKPDA